MPVLQGTKWNADCHQLARYAVLCSDLVRFKFDVLRYHLYPYLFFFLHLRWTWCWDLKCWRQSSLRDNFNEQDHSDAKQCSNVHAVVAWTAAPELSTP